MVLMADSAFEFDELSVLQQKFAAVAPTTKLDVLKRLQFRPETRGHRIARSLAALHQSPALQLTREQWMDAAENPEL